MADENHLKVVLEGADAIATWREENPGISLDLSGANLRRADLIRASLDGVDLHDANLEWADLRWADLVDANLSGAKLVRADLHKADLSNADLRRADLTMANLEDANLSKAIFGQTVFGYTRLINTDLYQAQGLETSEYRAPSTLDNETLDKSGPLPAGFAKSSMTGRDLERRVASIFRTLGAQVEHDVGLAGSQIDIVVREQTPSGSTSTKAIECKAYSRPVGVEIINSFASIADLLKQRGLIDHAAIVAMTGFTRHAREAAKQFRIELLELADLEQRVRGQKLVKEPLTPGERQPPPRKRVFVVMPFSQDLEDVYVLGIREVAEKLGLVVERADEIEHNANIVTVIQGKLKACDAVVAETTNQNPNVFYEVGYAHALNKQTILLTRQSDKIPFNLRTENHILYSGIMDLREKLEKRLRATLLG